MVVGLQLNNFIVKKLPLSVLCFDTVYYFFLIFMLIVENLENMEKNIIENMYLLQSFHSNIISINILVHVLSNFFLTFSLILHLFIYLSSLFKKMFDYIPE